MIYSLRRKLIWISGISVISVFIIIFAAIYIVSTHQLNTVMDTLTDRIASNDGSFPEIDEEHPLPPRVFFDFITEETKFSTRFFTVRYDQSGNIDSMDIEFVASVTEETARTYAEDAMNRNKDRGWVKGYRYKTYQTSMGAGGRICRRKYEPFYDYDDAASGRGSSHPEFNRHSGSDYYFFQAGGKAGGRKL